jgi:hypothetical protein
VKLNRTNILILLAVVMAAIVIFEYAAPSSSTTQVVSATDSDSQALREKRLAKLRKSAALVPEKTAALHQILASLQTREKGIMTFSTAAQAQARLLEVVKRLASANKIAAGGGDFSPPTLLGTDYGQVAVSVTFESTIDALVNFLADLSKEQELIAPAELHISLGNAKNKTVNVRLMVAEKKGGIGL